MTDVHKIAERLSPRMQELLRAIPSREAADLAPASVAASVTTARALVARELLADLTTWTPSGVRDNPRGTGWVARLTALGRGVRAALIGEDVPDLREPTASDLAAELTPDQAEVLARLHAGEYLTRDVPGVVRLAQLGYALSPLGFSSGYRALTARGSEVHAAAYTRSVEPTPRTFAAQRDARALAANAGHTVVPDPVGDLAAEVSALWDTLREDHLDLPAVAVDVSSARGTQCGYAPASSGTHTLRVPREVLAEGAEVVLRHVVHAAAHALSAVRGKADTSNRGRYHTDVFAGAAREIGMILPERADRSGTGFAAAVLPDSTVPGSPAWFAGEVAAIRAALPNAIAALPSKRAAPASGVRVVCRCVPPRPVRVPQWLASARTVACTTCGEVYRVE